MLSSRSIPDSSVIIADIIALVDAAGSLSSAFFSYITSPVSRLTRYAAWEFTSNVGV